MLSIFILFVLSYIFLIFLFLAGVPIFIFSIIFLINSIKRKINKTKKYVLRLVLSIIGICIGIIFIFPIFVYTSAIHSFFSNDKEIVETGTNIYWEEKDKITDFTRFYYNDRLYEEFHLSMNFYAEADKAIANIHTKDKGFIDSKLSINRNIYIIKNCNDFSLLADSKKPSQNSLYCDVEYFNEKKNYYENMDNYNYFISKTNKSFNYVKEYEIISRPLSETDLSFLENIKYGYSDNYIEIPEKKNYEYINYFGINIDGVAQIFFRDFLVDGEIIYYKIGRGSSSNKMRVVKIDDEYKNKIWALLE
jgi:energy-coupling factor transporter transmembrane protein EcfT